MTPNNRLALIVSYYLSRGDKTAYKNLGYSTFNEAANDIGRVLNVKPNTIKNMRDEFDPHHDNPRIGWKRELRGSRLKLLETFQEVDDETLLEISKEILQNKDFKSLGVYTDIQTMFKDRVRNTSKATAPFIVRGPTGKAAEQFYIDYFKKTSIPVNGTFVDCRDLGCGYDFEIKNIKGSYMIEVKGLSVSEGGILFTNKEWKTALKYKERYYLVLVSNISNKPEVRIIQNPALKFKADKNIYSTIQVSWSVNKKELGFIT